MTAELEQRLQFLLDGQTHCDHFLTPVADPRGKSVLVAGCGAGTEMLWCLRQGARSVQGIDVLEQDPAALSRARALFEVDDAVPAEIRRLDLLDARALGRRFDLVLSNNVFEHVGDVASALEACAAVLEPAHGRIAVFSSPLYYSSCGSHLEHEPWEHLWGEPEELRRRILAAGRAPEALQRLGLAEYLEREITLNRYRFLDYLAAARRAGLALYRLGILPDRQIGRFAAYRERLRARLGNEIAVQDLTTEGLFLELGPVPGAAGAGAAAAPALGPPWHYELTERLADSYRANDALRRELDETRALAHRFGAELETAQEHANRFGAELEAAQEHANRFGAELAAERAAVAEVVAVLARVERSASFRLGRALTAPARALRRRLRRPR